MGRKTNINKAENFLKKHIDLMICIVMVAVYFTLIAKIFSFILISPDDIAYKNIMSGVTTGTPDAHCYFLRYPLAVFLTFLYKLSENVAWYQLFLLGSLAWCVFLFFSRMQLLQNLCKKLYLVVATFAIVLLFTTHIISLEWTVTAGILGTTAAFRYVTMPACESLCSKVREYGICAALFLICFCIRHTVAYMFLPLMGLCWIKRILKLKTEMLPEEKLEAGKQMKDHIAFAMICLLGLGLIMVIHMAAYESKEWTAYKEYTKDRAILFDYYGYPDYDVYQTEYEAAGISMETYKLMKEDYNFLVPCNFFENIDIEAMADLSKKIKQEDFIGNIREMGKILWGIILDSKYLIINSMIILLICSNFSISRKRKIFESFFIGAVVLWALIMAGYLAYKGRLPERVVRCIFYGLLGVLSGNLFNFFKEDTEGETVMACILNIMCCVFLASMIAVEFPPLYRDNCKDAKLARSKMQLMQYCENRPENVYFRDFWSFSQRGELLTQHGYGVDNYLGTGGWTYNSPIFYELLKTRDCLDFHAAICNNQNIYYLVNEKRAQGVLNRLNEYFVSEMQPVRMKIVDRFQTESETVVVLNFSSFETK